MPINDSIYTANMTHQQRSWFYAEYRHARKDEVVGVLLAIFLGAFGIHHFYLRRNGLGVLYLVFSWIGIPTILGWIECFFMPGRVVRYNAAQALFISSQILGSASSLSTSSSTASICASCGMAIEHEAAFCRHCGEATSPHTDTQATI